MEAAAAILRTIALDCAEIYADGVGEKDLQSWTRIAETIVERGDEIVQAWEKIRESELKCTILVEEDVEILVSRVSEDQNIQTSVCWSISLLSAIVYDCTTWPGAYYFSLNGEDEMQILRRPIVYYIHMSQKTEDNLFFHAFLLCYALQSLGIDRLIVSIDFEFTRGHVEVMQMAFEHPTDLRTITHLVSPVELTDQCMDHYITTIMTNLRIKKLLHGSDAQDMPYIYHGMFGDKREWALAFAASQVDTRLLCDYYKLNNTDLEKAYCSIYDNTPERSAVLFFGVISEEQQEKLSLMMDSMPHHHDRQWNIHNAAQSMVHYAQYDVLFLKYFYYRVVAMGGEAVEKKGDASLKKNEMNVYRCIIPSLGGLVTLETGGFIGLKAECKKESDPANNYLIYHKGKPLKLNDIYKRVSPGIVTPITGVDMDRLSKVVQFRKTLEIILKRLVYGHVSQKCRVYIKKDLIWNVVLKNDVLLQFFDAVHMEYLAHVFREVDGILKKRVEAL